MKSPTERFKAFVVPEPMSGCFLWIGARQTTNGRRTRKMERYGFFHLAVGHQVYAHRYAWEREYGPIPPGAQVLHHCDNPACVNVRHLFLGDHASNMSDMRRKKRQSRGHKTKLTEAQVRQIRTSPLSLRAAAAYYGVDPSTISDIRRRKTWRDI